MADKNKSGKNREVGKLRPSEAVTMHGPGAIIDLPELSVIVASIDRWWPSAADRVMEPRLEAFIGDRALYRPPKPGKGKYGGVPALVFPEWMVCPYWKCRRLAPFDDFAPRDHPVEFVCDAPEHSGQMTVFPARFLMACARGHVDDFPWRDWAHGGPTDCGGPLQLIDTGSSGSANDLIVKCSCGEGAAMGRAFQKDALEHCTGRQPWISPSRYEDGGCDASPRTLLRGASNAYFPVVTSALSIPPWSDPIHRDLAPYEEILNQADSWEKFSKGVELGFYDLGGLLEKGHTLAEIWEAHERQGDPPDETDLRVREYEALCNPEANTDRRAEFEAQWRHVPEALENQLEDVIAVTRLREVRALRAFTRIDSIPEVGEMHDVSKIEASLAPLGPKDTRWRPATELRGEGIFLRFSEEALAAWESQEAVESRGNRIGRLFDRAWQNRLDRPFPGMRYVLVHTFSHALMRQLSLYAGHSSSALRERMYCDVAEGTAGLLIHPAASDSDGSLGGLVDLANPDRLGLVVHETLKAASFCASDPLCAGGRSSKSDLNGASCHACLLVAETSCEMGNRLLDRGTLVPTLAESDLAFFDAPE